MIVSIQLIHNWQKIVQVKSTLSGVPVDRYLGVKPTVALNRLRNDIENQLFSQTFIILFVDQNYASLIDLEYVNNQFKFNEYKVVSQAMPQSFFTNSIDFIEQSPFIKINKSVVYPTWIVSGLGFATTSKVIGNLELYFFKRHLTSQLDYCLNSLTKLLMPVGVFCYSDPFIIPQEKVLINQSASRDEVYRFVREHRKVKWLFFLLVSHVWYLKKWSIFSFLKHLFFTRQIKIDTQKWLRLKQFGQQSFEQKKIPLIHSSIDVVIPTYKRKDTLLKVLECLKNQTLLCSRVIIIEQNSAPNGQSELDYLNTQNWPFQITHRFIRQLGACHARNLAFELVENDWVFLADDDIVFESTFMESALTKLRQLGVKALLTSCLTKDEKLSYFHESQTTIFGSGCSFIHSDVIKNNRVLFDITLEFGYGEDIDFGMQLRNHGIDIIYSPEVKILHLKHPRGGFRSVKTPVLNKQKNTPKPSVSVMLVKRRYFTENQLKGYQLLLFIETFFKSISQFKFHEIRTFKKRWNLSRELAIKRDKKKNIKIENQKFKEVVS